MTCLALSEEIQKLNALMKLAGKAGTVILQEDNDAPFLLQCWWPCRDGGFDTDEYFKNMEKLKYRINGIATGQMSLPRTDEERQLDFVKSGYSISKIKHPSEAVQIAAVAHDGYAILDIKNPSEEVQIAAVQQSGTAIRYIDSPSEAVQLAAVTSNGYAIQYINNPSEEMIFTAVNQNGNAIAYIDNPSDQVKSMAELWLSSRWEKEHLNNA